MVTEPNILGTIDDYLQQLTVEQTDLENQLRNVKEEVRKFTHVRKVLSTNGSKPQRKKKTTTGDNNTRINFETPSGVKIREVLTDFKPDAEFTGEDITIATSLSRSVVDKYLAALRETGEILLVRKGGPRGVTHYYKVA